MSKMIKVVLEFVSLSSSDVEIQQYQGSAMPINEDIGKKKHNTAENNTYLGTLRSWAENSSTTGIPNIERSKHPIRIIIWVIVVLVGAGW